MMLFDLGFRMIPCRVLKDTRLSCEAKLLFAFLFNGMPPNRKYNLKEHRAEIEHIVGDVGLMALKDYFVELEKAGYIEIINFDITNLTIVLKWVYCK